MAARITRVVLLALVALTSSDMMLLAEDQETPDTFFNSFYRDTKRRNCWPEPFNAPDRVAVRAPFAAMIVNGWRRQNLISSHYFDSNTGTLNEAGVLKIRWIINEAPQQHRIVYVRTADTQDETARRLAVVQEKVVQLTPPDTVAVPILVTAISDEGWSAERAEAITRSYQKSAPTPRLSSSTGSSTGGSSMGTGTSN
jgi:hypothetical protein